MTRTRQTLLELLAGEAAGDLTAAERAALRDATDDAPDASASFMQTAALVQLAFLSADPAAPAPMPEDVRTRLGGLYRARGGDSNPK